MQKGSIIEDIGNYKHLYLVVHFCIVAYMLVIVNVNPVKKALTSH